LIFNAAPGFRSSGGSGGTVQGSGLLTTTTTDVKKNLWKKEQTCRLTELVQGRERAHLGREATEEILEEKDTTPL